MTAAFDARSIVKAQHTLSAVAYATHGGRTLTKKQQRKRDAVIEVISQDVVMVEAITIAGSTSYLAGTKPEALAATWEEAAQRKLVGDFIGAPLIFAILYRVILPLLLEWAREWLKQQQLNSVSITTKL